MKRKTLLIPVLGLTLLVGITVCSVPGAEVGEAETGKETESVVSVQDIENTDTSTEEEGTLIIASAEELIAFAEQVNSGEAFGYYGQTIRLEADIDLEGITWSPIGNLNDMENGSTFFMGTFDGNGHTISNLTYVTDEPVTGAGLFGISVGVVENLTLENCSVTVNDLTPGDSQAVAALIGYNMGGVVQNCTVRDSRASGLNCVALICGGSGGSVYNCTVENGNVTILGDNDFSGGLRQCDVAECGGLIVGGAFGGTITDCTANGSITAEGNEPVGLGGIAGCMEMMNEASGNTVDVTITTLHGGHAIGGLCGYAGTHSDAEKVMAETGVEVTNYPGLIHDCTVNATLIVPDATHVGGMIGTGLYYFGEETIWNIYNCSVTAEITGAVTPGTLFGRVSEGTIWSDCTALVTIDGNASENETGNTAVMYESLDQD